ncbi:MAG: methylisocitrate lyase [Pseudomonadota bacterium]|nr:methylisocitrate lyase [Alphaproteobacteria bacterium]MEC7702600.1 methylisocitrate lyase [Pseudomonadota bacterium]MEC9235232.1 methylisocitrate lyase [Pseudomonadota bacterium]|tara:strand:- start:21935 stop:22816 length:882 start_codon:yes stop_codon:yes gene_type:complete
MTQSQGAKMRQLLKEEKPLQVVGAINAYSAMLARDAGHKAIYLSGAGVANASFGLPDLGMTNLADVCEDARRITGAVDLPLLVDIDVGWGNAFNIARTIKEMERAGVAAVHMEDQIAAKRCGHRPNKELVSKEEMGDRIKAALDAKTDENFIVMARCDALAVEGFDAAVERSAYYAECGADAIFAEAMTDLAHYRIIKDAVGVPLLANITEFGKTDLYTAEELADHGVDMALYPLSAFRAMSKAALEVYGTIKKDGTQKACVDKMQTRAELYEHLEYMSYEQQLDRLHNSKNR